MSEQFSIETDEVLDFASNLNGTTNNAGDTAKKMVGEFTGMSKLTGETTRVISQQLGSIGESLNNYRKILASNVEKGVNFDADMANLATKIEVPLDFTANNSMDTNKFNAIFISKDDDKSVNEGHTTQMVNDLDESTVVASALTNISGDQTKEQSYDDTTIIGKSILGNIAGNQTQQQTYDDSTSIGNKGLKNISGDQTKEQTYDDSSSIQNKNLGNISGNQTVQQTYDSSSAVRNQALGSMNSNETVLQEYDDSVVVGKSILGETDKKENSEEDAIAAAMKSKDDSTGASA